MGGRGKAPGLHVDCDCCFLPAVPWVPPPPVYGPKTVGTAIFDALLRASIEDDFDAVFGEVRPALEFFKRLDQIATLVGS